MNDMHPTVFSAACEAAGGRARCASLFGVTRGRVDQVARGEGVPADSWCVILERETAGQFTADAINPSAHWQRMPSDEWPWHSNGRPVIDPLPATASLAEA